MELLDVVPGPAFVPLAPRPEMLRPVKKYMGGVPKCMTYLTEVPWVFHLFRDIAKPTVFVAPPALVELIGWATAFENSCRHCYGAQRAMMRILGHSDEWIARVERDATLADVDPQQRGVLDLARKLARSNPRPARAEREALTAQYGAAAAVELAYVVTGWCFTTRVATFLRLPPDPELERLPDRWFLPVVRPLLRWMLRKPAHRPEVLPLDGPFYPIIAPMGEVAAAHVLRRAIDGALASPVLPRRAKLLVFAVVARSLPCTTTEAEACRLLAAEGLDAAQVDEILRNLGSAALDPLETLLVTFARASVRYDHLEVQDRVGRDLVPKLSAPELIEATAVAALANSIARMAMFAA